MTLRDELAQVPWAVLQHAYGAAEDTPGHLLALLSPDEDEYHAALSELWASICHQGSVYEASCAAVPFLIEILKQLPDERKPAILYLLAGLAHQGWYAHRDRVVITLRRPSDAGNITAEQRHHTWSYAQFLEEGNIYHERQWTHEGHLLVGAGMQTYLLLLRSNDSRLVLAALHLMSAFRELGEQVIPAVNELLVSSATDPFITAGALDCLAAVLPSDSPLWARRFFPIISNAEPEHTLVRFVAALSLAWHHRTGITPAAVNILVDAMVAPQRLDELYEVLPDRHNSVHVEACSALASLGSPIGLDGLIVALDRGTPAWRVVDTARVAEALLDVAFFGNQVRGRYWTRCLQRPARTHEQTLAELADRLTHGDMRPYEDKSYWGYGTAYGLEHQLDIRCSEHDRQSAAQLKDRFAREGSRALSNDQRRAVEAVLRCAPLWQVKTNFLEVYGLPTDESELRRFLSGGEHNPSS